MATTPRSEDRKTAELIYGLRTALEVAEKRATEAEAEMHARELHHFEEEQISDNQAHNLRVVMADRDRLHKAITEARKLNDRAQRDPDIWEDMDRILRAAVDQEGNNDGRV